MDPEVSKSGGVLSGKSNGRFLMSFVLTLGLGAFQYGYSIGVYNSMQVNFEYLFGWKTEGETNMWNGIITSICALGSAVGSIIAGIPAERWGKLRAMHVTNLILIVGCALSCYQSMAVILAGKFLFGFAAGAFSVFVPSFINELVPNEIKGTYGSLTQILITLGIFISYLFGLPLPESVQGIKSNFMNDDYWRVVNAIPILFAIL